jgi:hypothetical protein
MAAAEEQNLVINSKLAVGSLYEQEAVTKSLSTAMSVGLAGAITLGAFALADFLAGLDDVKVDITSFAAKSSTELDKVAHSFTGVQQYTAFGKDSLKDYENQLIAGDVPAAERFADALDRAGIKTDDFRKRIDEKRQGDIAAAADQDTYTSAVGGAKDATEKSTGAIKDNTAAVFTNIDAVKGLIDQQHAAIDPFFAVMKATKDNADAQKDYNDAVKKSGAGSQEASDALMKVASTALDVNDATQQLAASMRDGKTSTKDAKDQLAVWVAQGLVTQKQADTIALVGGSVKGPELVHLPRGSTSTPRTKRRCSPGAVAVHRHLYQWAAGSPSISMLAVR